MKHSLSGKMTELENVQWPGWTDAKPSEPGLYLFRDAREWIHRVLIVKQGSWRLGQNPDVLYAGSMPVSSLYNGYWLGPIPESPN